MKFSTVGPATFGKSISCAVLVAGLPLAAQNGAFASGPFQTQQMAQQTFQPAPAQSLLPVNQLANLLSPIALYPDPLLGLVLAASTYPLEIVEAQQWLLQNRNLAGEQLIQAAKQQNWDPSVQTLVAFPDAMALLTRDIRWTTDIGNAFLAQQQDVMTAIQTLRARAQGSGRLFSGPQQIVTWEAQNGQNAIAIQPANPQVIYVPTYNPQTVWGPPAEGAYPPLAYSASYAPGYYGSGYQPSYQAAYQANVGGAWSSGYGPAYSGGYGGGYGGSCGGNYGGGLGSSVGSNIGSTIGSGIAYGAGVILNTLFTGLTHFSPWGWALNWLVHTLFLNPLFFHNNGYHGYDGYGGGYSTVAWVHNPVHRLGIAYPNHFVAARFGGYNGGGYSSGYRGGSGFRSEAFRSSGYNAATYPSRGGGWSGAGGEEFRQPQNRVSPGFSSSYAAQGYGGYRGGSGVGFNDHFAPSAGRYGGFAENNRGYASPAPRQFAQNFGPSNFGNHFNGGSHFSEPKNFGGGHAEHFSAPKAPHFSAPHSSHGHSGGGGGHSGKGSRHR